MIHLHSICKTYGQRIILDSLSVSFAKKTTTLLCGRNGSGKTTMLKIIAGLIKPTTGTVEFVHEPHTPPPSLSYVGHQTFLYPNMTAFENLKFWSDCYHLSFSDDDIYGILKTVDLLPFSDEYTRSFSRGMCQRVNLARALLQKPDILLLDEPFTGLDDTSQDLLRKEIMDAKDHGTCTLIISHDLAKDSALADTILSLEKGHLIPLHN